jgi:hypothetical protein
MGLLSEIPAHELELEGFSLQSPNSSTFGILCPILTAAVQNGGIDHDQRADIEEQAVSFISISDTAIMEAN